MGTGQRPIYAFIKFRLEHHQIKSVQQIFNVLDIPLLAEDLGVPITVLNTLIKDPSLFSFEAVYQLSLLFDCDFKNLVSFFMKHILTKKGIPLIKRKIK